MATRTRTSTLTKSSDVEFEPYCEWKKEDGTETLVLHLSDFKKDQLRVQVNNLGVLKVSGERPLDKDSKRKTRFLKETKIPQGCDINDIRAKFTGGQLHVIMPQKAATPQTQQPQLQEQAAATSSAGPSSEDAQKSKAEALNSKEQELKAPISGTGSVAANSNYDQPNDHLLAKLQVQKKVGVSLGVAVVALVAIGAYVAYKFGSSDSSTPPLSHLEE